MPHFLRKLLSVLLICLVLSQIFYAFAQEVVLHEESVKFPVTRGVSYEGRTIFTSSGWQKVHILTIDLTSENVDIDAFMNKNGLSERQILSKLVSENGAVAGVNGDFFIMANPSSPIGIQIAGGKLISTPSNRSDMASFALTYEKIPQILRFEFTGKIIAPNGASFDVGGINKLGDGYGKIMIYTPEFGKTTPQVQATSPELTYAVVKDGRIASIFDGRSAEIPEGGIVLAGGGGASSFLKNNFFIGDEVKIELHVTPDIANLKMALGGGAVLVDNGKIPASFSHNILGQHPRTAVGFTKDGKKLILVVVDGRQAESRGMTQEELARLMLSFGAYNALNLDGGGSSTMVVREPGEKTPGVVNSPSEKAERPVVNGIGIFSRLSSSGKVYGFKITASSFNIPKNGRRVFEIKAYDENYNPVDVDPNLVRWEVTGDLGTFEGNVFYARKTGTGTVTASIGGIKASAQVRVLGDAVDIIVEPDRVELSPGQKQTFRAYAVDAEGYKAPIEPNDIKWEIAGDGGYIENGLFIAPQAPGSCAVIAEFSNIKAGALVKIGESGRFDESLLPSKPLITDGANVPFKKGGLTFGVFGDLLLEANYNPAYLKIFNMARAVFDRQKASYNIIAGRLYATNSPPENAKSLPPLNKFLTANTGYLVHKANDTLFVFLNASKGSIRLTDPTQWIKLKEDVKSAASSYNNLVVVLDRAISSFQDSQEGELLKKVLSENKASFKNILVLCGGAKKFASNMENGVKYISVPGVNAEEPAALIFNIQESKIYYRVIPLIENIVSETPSVRKGIPSRLKLFGISPTGFKVPLEYPYAAEYNITPPGACTLDSKTLEINGKKAVEIEITVKTEVFTGKVKLYISDVGVKVNGKEINFPDQQPYINEEQRTMVPVRFVSEHLSARVHWDDRARQVIIQKDGNIVTLRVGEKSALVNGKKVNFDTKAELKNSRVVVPLRFISEVLGAKITWDEKSRTVEITAN
ncbi:Copper amine oxidase N-terminal domain-containing protein [Caldanaerovirga acetigignens]|uniref:Copper amine oxidase N-terminal domain-containing protein n=1 Tax=Caldanaerovirga acetigignens TaxID=447595 RepID=A0A1M7HLG1_9FIRM|nr:Copper amine oxidase N-terminal domain-containing protein [Caldanaerovirga acetigignens]